MVLVTTVLVIVQYNIEYKKKKRIVIYEVFILFMASFYYVRNN